MNKKSLVLVLATSLIASSAFAGPRTVVQGSDSGWENAPPAGPLTPDARLNWVAALDIGAAWENAGDTQTILIAPELEKTFKSDRATHIVADIELFAGFQKTLSQTLQGQFGLALAASGNASVTGVVWDDTFPEFNNYTYSYKVQHTHLAVKAKFLLDLDYWVTPWLSCSFGAGINKASSFSSTPRIFEAVPTPSFDTHTLTSFTYTVGAGIQKPLDEHWQLGIGYEFADWGKNRLAQGPYQIYNTGLSIDNFYTNSILLNITYISEGV